MAPRIGGWSRIWIVVSALFFIVGASLGIIQYRNELAKVDADYIIAETDNSHLSATAKAQADCAAHASDDIDKLLCIRAAGAQVATVPQNETPENRPSVARTDLAHQFLADAQAGAQAALQSAAIERGKRKEKAFTDAWQSSLLIGGIPSAILAALLFLIGWIRRGFRKTTPSV